MSPPTPNDQQTSPGACPEILLIPWDPDSPAHVDRMVQQRLACGWHAGDVEAWAALQREGKKGLHWIVSSSRFSASLLTHADASVGTIEYSRRQEVHNLRVSLYPISTEHHLRSAACR